MAAFANNKLSPVASRSKKSGLPLQLPPARWLSQELTDDQLNKNTFFTYLMTVKLVEDSMMKCIVCSATNSQTVLSKPGTPVSTVVQKCQVCGTAFLASWEQDYSVCLYDYYGDPEWRRKFACDDLITESRYIDLLKIFRKQATGKKILDIGCGIGRFVKVANANGWQAMGIEVSRPAVEFAQSKGLPVYQIDLFSSDLAPESFEVCTMFEVIEHVPEPAAFLGRVAELIKPGGLLYMTTPNFASLDRYLLQEKWGPLYPEHLSYFTPGTLLNLIRRTGKLDPLWLRTRNVSIPAIKSRLLRSTDADSTGFQDEDDMIRQQIEGSIPLKVAKRIINQILSWTGKGSAMTVLCRKT